VKKRYFFLYLMVFTIPILLALTAWQSARYQNLFREVKRLEQMQAEWVESNKRYVADIAEYSSPQRIVDIAENKLGLKRIRPEYLLQVKITEGREHGF